MNHLKPNAHSKLESKIEDEVTEAVVHQAVGQVAPPHCWYAVPGDIMNEVWLFSWKVLITNPSIAMIWYDTPLNLRVKLELLHKKMFFGYGVGGKQNQLN